MSRKFFTILLERLHGILESINERNTFNLFCPIFFSGEKSFDANDQVYSQACVGIFCESNILSNAA